MHMSTEKYEATGYGHNFDSLIISNQFRASYPMRRFAGEKYPNNTHVYLTEHCKLAIDEARRKEGLTHHRRSCIVHSSISTRSLSIIWCRSIRIAQGG